MQPGQAPFLLKRNPSMAIDVTCAGCGGVLCVPEHLRGKKARCWGCRAVVTIPVADTGEENPQPRCGPPAEQQTAPATGSRRRPSDGAGEDRKKEKRWQEWRRKPGRGTNYQREKKRAARELLAGLVICGGGLFLVCAVCGLAGYRVWDRDRRAEAPINPLVSRENAAQIKWRMSLAEVEGILGPGKRMKRDDLHFFIHGLSKESQDDAVEQWRPSIDRGAVYGWKSGVEGILVSFSADPLQGGKMNRMLTRTRLPDNYQSFTVSDTGLFIDLGEDSPRGLPPLAILLTAGELGKEYKLNRSAADSKYKGKWLAVEGLLADIDVDSLRGGIVITLGGYKADEADTSNEIRCVIPPGDADRILRTSRGQRLEVRGRCSGMTANLFIDLLECDQVLLRGPDPGIRLDLSRLAKEQAKDPMAAAKYEQKQVSIRGFLVELKEGNAARVAIIAQSTSKGSKGPALQLSAAYPDSWKERFARYRPGDPICITGEFSSLRDGVVHVNRCWPVP
jgi:hypothetical protein